MKKFKYPKYRIGQQVNTPDGEGTIKDVQYLDGVHWYQTSVSKGYYKESEIARI